MNSCSKIESACSRATARRDERPARRVSPRRVNPRRGEVFRAAAILLAAAVAFSAPAAHGQCYYTSQEIPDPPGNPPQFTAPRELNNLGHAAGRYSNGGDTARAFFWSPETGTYLLPYPPGINDMIASGINDLDQVCGRMATSSPPYRHFGFIWDRESGEYTTIELPAWATQIDAAAINNAGVIVGTLFSSWQVRAFRWQDGVFYDLAADLGVISSQAYDVNERGEVCGEGGPGTDQTAFYAHAQGITWLPRPAGFSNCDAWGLSNTGFFTGLGVCGPAPTCVHGLVWTSNAVHDLAPPPGFGRVLMYDVNDAGRAVGGADRAPNGGASHALVWQDGVLTDVNTLTVPGTPLRTTAIDINESGQILAGRSVLTPVWRAGDLTGDCHVAINDLVLVLTNFGSPRGSFPRGDVNSDGEVDLTDLAILLAHWGE